MYACSAALSPVDDGPGFEHFGSLAKFACGIRRSLAAELAAGLQADSALSSSAPLRGWQVQALLLPAYSEQALPSRFAPSISVPPILECWSTAVSIEDLGSQMDSSNTASRLQSKLFLVTHGQQST